MRRRRIALWLALLVALAAAPAPAQVLPLIRTGDVEDLPAAGSLMPWWVTDGATSSDCTTGGGTAKVWCYWSGAAWVAIGGGVSDHGALTGLADDDHPQYLTAAEGAAAYLAIGADAAGLACTDCVALGTETTGGYAASVSEAGPATTATALAADGTDCGAGSYARGVDAGGNATGCTADADTDTDDQTAAEAPYTPAVGADWTDPDPDDAAEGLDDLAARLTVEEATADDDTPESGDFGAAADLEADGSLSADVVAAAEMADADHGDVAWSGGVASVQAGTATTAGALAANGGNCSAGNYPLGVDASGAVESCTADDDVPDTGEVAVSALANGTDGELITWGADGVATTVAVGTATHVLTSNGAGAPPTFQAAAGGSSNAISQGDSSATVTDAGTGSFSLLLDAGAVFALTTGGVATVGRTNTGGQIELQDGNVSIRDAGGNDFRVEADNTDVLNVSSAGLRVMAGVFSLDPVASAPATCTAARDFYTDTSGAACFCSSTNTWEQLNAVGSCT